LGAYLIFWICSCHYCHPFSLINVDALKLIAKLQQFVVFGRWTEVGLEKELEGFPKNI
jgi:hypothetical protein